MPTAPTRRPLRSSGPPRRPSAARSTTIGPTPTRHPSSGAHRPSRLPAKVSRGGHRPVRQPVDRWPSPRRARRPCPRWAGRSAILRHRALATRRRHRRQCSPSDRPRPTTPATGPSERSPSGARSRPGCRRAHQRRRGSSRFPSGQPQPLPRRMRRGEGLGSPRPTRRARRVEPLPRHRRRPPSPWPRGPGRPFRPRSLAPHQARRPGHRHAGSRKRPPQRRPEPERHRWCQVPHGEHPSVPGHPTGARGVGDPRLGPGVRSARPLRRLRSPRWRRPDRWDHLVRRWPRRPLPNRLRLARRRRRPSRCSRQRCRCSGRRPPTPARSDRARPPARATPETRPLRSPRRAGR